MTNHFSSSVVGAPSGVAEKTRYSGLNLLLQAPLLVVTPIGLVLNVAMRNLEDYPLQSRSESIGLSLMLTWGITLN